MPAKVSVKMRPIVTAGLAKILDEVKKVPSAHPGRYGSRDTGFLTRPNAPVNDKNQRARRQHFTDPQFVTIALLRGPGSGLVELYIGQNGSYNGTRYLCQSVKEAVEWLHVTVQAIHQGNNWVKVGTRDGTKDCNKTIQATGSRKGIDKQLYAHIISQSLGRDSTAHDNDEQQGRPHKFGRHFS